jgi:hypothetical protein
VARAVARHASLPPVRVADKVLEGVNCILLDATVITAHSDKEGYGHHPPACDGAGASRDLVKELDWLASRHGYQLTYSAGWGALRAGEGPRSARSRGRVDDRHRSPEGFFGRYTPETGWVLAKP